VLNIAGNAADDMTSGWYPGRMLMMTQHRLHRSGFIRLISGKRANRSQVPYQEGVLLRRKITFCLLRAAIA
jgi:hypothetical protein